MTGTGLFITFEGGEGSGKSTQVKKLAQWYEQQGRSVLITREPGGTPDAENLRNLLVQRDGGKWDPIEECLLLFAARHSHVNTLIKPALENGKIVICDRFIDSTYAYQAYGMGVDFDLIDTLNDKIMGGFMPDLTFVLDIDPEMGLKRSVLRINEGAVRESEQEDRYERMDFTFHKKIRQAFLDIASRNSGRCHVVDATQDVDTIADHILEIVTNSETEAAGTRL